ncbi:hypothetical protein P4E94_14825 [Pontiellaceae bacterium B12219]|nr:hypothetical protein [Pontiellaceae bacterium B12219]
MKHDTEAAIPKTFDRPSMKSPECSGKKHSTLYLSFPGEEYSVEFPEAKAAAYLFVADIIDKQINCRGLGNAFSNINALAELIEHHPHLQEEAKVFRQLFEASKTLMAIPEIADKLISYRKEEEAS